MPFSSRGTSFGSVQTSLATRCALSNCINHSYTFPISIKKRFSFIPSALYFPLYTLVTTSVQSMRNIIMREIINAVITHCPLAKNVNF